MTKTVGLRELKNRLSEYVRYVRRGHRVLVTDRGEIVAELRPPEAATKGRIHPGLAALAARGAIILGKGNRPSLYPAMPHIVPAGTAQRLLDEERGER